VLGCGVSALALGTALGALPAYAQNASAGGSGETAKSTAVGEVVVTGIRQSLQNAQRIKQNADVVVDSVTAADISALPDRSVTEALQRIPGVTIDRFAAGRDPDHFSVEGNGVTVRGLTWTLSEINGREAFSANNGRGLSFQDVPSELMAGVDVFKSPSADMIEGAIAGTINLRTRLPFDSPGLVVAASGEASYGDFVKKWAPTGVIFLSDRWNTDIGEIGLMVNAVRSELYSRSDGQQISNFGRRFADANGNLIAGTPAPGATPPAGDKVVWMPRGAAFREDTFDHIRTGYGAAAQWRSNDHTMEATLNFLRSDTKQAWTEHAMEIATDNVTSNGDSMNVQGTSLTFDNDGVFTGGTITGPTGWRSDQFSSPRTPIYGLQSNNIRRDVLQNNHVSDYSANFRWTPNEDWGFNLDYQHVEAKVTDLDDGLWVSTYQNAQIQMRGSDVPIVNFLPPSLNGTVQTCSPPNNNCPSYYNAPHNSFSDPYNSFNRSAMDHVEDSTGNENAVRLDLERKFGGDSFITAVKAGYRFSDRDEITRYSTYNWGVVTEQWGNGGPIWLNQSVGGQPLAPNYQTWAFDNFMRGAAPVPTGSEPRLFYAPNIVQNYAQYAAFASAYAKAWQASGGWVPLAGRAGVIPGTPFLPGEINPVDEKTHAAYVMANYKFPAGGWTISGNLGLRYFHTDRVTQGYLSFPVTNFPNCTPGGGNLPDYCILVSAQTRGQATAFQNGANVNTDAKTSFHYWLPSWNMKVDMGGGKLLRFAVSKGVSFPDVGLTRNYENIQLSALSQNIFNGTPEALVTAGNPFLKPQWAWSYDATFEWYFGKLGQISIAGFYKDVHDVISNGTVSTTVSNNGASFPVILTTATNSTSTGKVKGFELSYQEAFTMLPSPFDGLGLNANFTYVSSSGVAQSTLSETDPNVAAGNIANVDTSKLPLQGLSKYNFNLEPFYEKGPFSLRLAYSWRSRYLLTTRDVIVPFAPIMQEDMGTLDGSLFYAINKNVKVGVQGVNLLNSITRTSSVLTVDNNGKMLTAPRSWFMDDRRYTFIIRTTW
jgi:TonB-dependent receptor